MLHGKIYQRFLDFCYPYSLGGLWHGFQSHTDLWSPPTDSSTALAALRQLFDDSELREGGIASGDPGDTMVLNPILCDQRTIILALRETTDHAPFDLVVNEGCLSGQLPVCAVMKDERVLKVAARVGYLAVTFSMEDLAALRLMGLPAISASGLADVRRETMTEFCQCLAHQRSPKFGQNEDSPVPSQNTGASTNETCPPEEGEPVTEYSISSADEQAMGPRPELVFVGWSPAKLELVEPDQLKDIVRHFAAIEQYLQVPMNDVYAWRPTQAELDRLMFCLQHGIRKDVKEALLVSMDQSAEPITAPARGSAVSKSLPEAMLRLEDVVRRSVGNEVMEKQAWADYEERVNSELAMPLLQLAMTTAEPMQRNLMATTASIARVLHPQAMLIAAKITRRIATSGLGKVGGGPDKDVKRLLELTDRLIDLNKELRECKQRGKARPKPTRP